MTEEGIMSEYKRTVPLSNEGAFFVNLGRLDHINGPGRYPFPTNRSAVAFAKANKQAYPAREITIDYPDGRRWDGEKWVTWT